MKHTQSEKNRAEKKVQIAIDKMVDLQDMGFGTDKVARVLELLNEMDREISES